MRSGSRTAEVTHHQGTAGGCEDSRHIYAQSLDSLREAFGVSISVYYPKSSKYGLNVATQLKHQRSLRAPRPRNPNEGTGCIDSAQVGGKLRMQMCGEIKETPRSSAINVIPKQTQLEWHVLIIQSSSLDVPMCHRRRAKSLFNKGSTVNPTGQQGAQIPSSR